MKTLMLILAVLVVAIIVQECQRSAYYRAAAKDRLVTIWNLRAEIERLQTANDCQARILAMHYPLGVKFDWR